MTFKVKILNSTDCGQVYPGRFWVDLHVGDVRGFVTWHEATFPNIEIKARYQLMEKVERAEKIHLPREVVVSNFITIIASPRELMLFKLACPFL